MFRHGFPGAHTLNEYPKRKDPVGSIYLIRPRPGIPTWCRELRLCSITPCINSRKSSGEHFHKAGLTFDAVYAG